VLAVYVICAEAGMGVEVMVGGVPVEVMVGGVPVEAMVGGISVEVIVGVSAMDGVTICGINVHVGALVREGEGWIVVVGVQVLG
jgi:hypothetical protein